MTLNPQRPSVKEHSFVSWCSSSREQRSNFSSVQGGEASPGNEVSHTFVRRSSRCESFSRTLSKSISHTGGSTHVRPRRYSIYIAHTQAWATVLFTREETRHVWRRRTGPSMHTHANVRAEERAEGRSPRTTTPRPLLRRGRLPSSLPRSLDVPGRGEKKKQNIYTHIHIFFFRSLAHYSHGPVKDPLLAPPARFFFRTD